jgi:putative membrane protein
MSSERSVRGYLAVLLRGMAMGAADVVPGVSGGTIAFITGIYEELIDSLRSIDHRAVLCLFKQGPAAAWRHINGSFLLSLFGGVLLSMLSLAKLISQGLDHYPILVWSFFFGLVLASGFHISRQISLRQGRNLLMLLIGIGLAVGVSLARPAELPGEWWIVGLSGALAICAMILPGISGSFILLLIGVYGVVLEAAATFNLGLLASFAVGCGIGLLAFSHVLSWLLHRFHDLTLALLTGFLLGSLNIIWPWKQTLETTVNRHGELVPLVQQNILPATYEAVQGVESQLVGAVVVFAGGLLLVLMLEWLAKPAANKPE